MQSQLTLLNVQQVPYSQVQLSRVCKDGVYAVRTVQNYLELGWDAQYITCSMDVKVKVLKGWYTEGIC